MTTCLFCKNTAIFNIHKGYGDGNHTAKEDMIQFFGYQIESNLLNEDALCSLCTNIMDNVAKLKRRLLPLIFRGENGYLADCRPMKFGRKWNIFASMSFDDDSDMYCDSRSPTPSTLLKCAKVVPYETPLEMKFAEAERIRSLSRISYAKSDADSEVANAFTKKRGRRKKRGHNWSRRKNGRYSRADTEARKSVTSTYTRRTRSRPVSSLSIMSSESYETFYPPHYEAASPVTVSPKRKTNLRYLDGCLQNRRTRSVTYQLEAESRLQFKDDFHEYNDLNFKEVEVKAKNRTNKTSHLPLFWCNLCGTKYTSSLELDMHKRTHVDQYSCVICHEEFYSDTDLLEHWREHVRKSVPCNICGKKFINKDVCNKHQKNEHKRIIPDRFDYKDSEPNSLNNKNFEVRILVQDGSHLLED